MGGESRERRYAELDAAQEMAVWFHGYLIGVSGEIGELSMTGKDRLYGLFGDGDPADQLTILAELFDQFNEDEQMALSLYLCGYPETALKVLSDLELGDIIARLDTLLIPFWASKTESGHEQSHEDEVNKKTDSEHYRLRVVLGRFSTDETMRGEWRKKSICKFEDPELFFPIGRSEPAILQAKEAAHVCNSCPAKNNCLEHALDEGYQGVWGATTEDERRLIRRQHGLHSIRDDYSE